MMTPLVSWVQGCLGFIWCVECIEPCNHILFYKYFIRQVNEKNKHWKKINKFDYKAEFRYKTKVHILFKKWIKSFLNSPRFPYFFPNDQWNYYFISNLHKSKILAWLLTTTPTQGCYPPCEVAKNPVDQVPDPLEWSQDFP